MARLIRFNDAAFRRMVTDHVEDITEDVYNQARVTTPYRTGDLESSIRRRVDTTGDTITGTVYTDLEYAVYVHEGRGPVRARPGGVLGPLPPPYPRFVKRVGPADAQPWLFEALRDAQPYPVTRGR